MGVNDRTQIKLTVPDDFDVIEGNESDSLTDKGANAEGSPDLTDKGSETKTNDKPTPYDKDPKWVAARAAQKHLDSIMAKVGASSPEELQELIDQSASVLDKVKGIDLDKALSAAAEADRVKAFLAEQEAEKLEAAESYEETIARLKKEKKDAERGYRNKEAQEQDRKEAQETLKSFTRTVESAITSSKEVPEEYHDFAKMLMGVGNPANEIDITNKAEVKKMTSDLIKVLSGFEQAVIARYRGGKTNTVPMSSNSETPSKGRKPIKSIEAGTKVLREMFAKSGYKM
jgi:hypothetical protein